MTGQTWVRETERPFTRTVEDWCAQTTRNHSWYLTEFLTPREQYLATSIVRREGLELAQHGGYDNAERQRMLLMPDNWYPQFDDFEITCLRAEVQGGVIRHRDVLGSVLGLGVQRRTIGDMAIDRSTAYVFVATHMARFLYDEWRQIGRYPILLSVFEETLSIPAPHYEERDVSVVSLRLDAILAHACQLSRGRAQDAVDHGDVTLNFSEVTRKDEVAVGDILSLRGFGRVKVLEVLGRTKRERLRVRVGILRSNA